MSGLLLNAAGDPIERTPVVSLSPVDHNPPDSPEQLAVWQAELDRINDPAMKPLSSLNLVWVAGDPWQPIGRYVIYLMYAEGVIPFGINEADLKGPDPRTYAGYFDQALGAFVRLQHITIDRMQWSLYQETRRFGVPYWVVQGTNGGHLRRFTPVQAALSKLEGGWTEPPAPGDLPFARPDNRTFEALRELDLLGRYEGLLAFHLRKPEMLQAEQAEQARRMRARMWNQLKAQQEGYWSDEDGVIRAIIDRLPAGLEKRKGPDYEAIERRFIEDD